jgi:flagellar biosynthesis GTPase FlhF
MGYEAAADVIPIIRPNQTMGISHIPTGTILKGPDENVMMVHQQAVEMRVAKERRLHDFQKKTKFAARNYIESMKSAEQVKSENDKKFNEDKKRKKKEFEDKLKNMRKTMKTKKPQTSNNDKQKRGNKENKPTIKVTKQSM